MRSILLMCAAAAIAISLAAQQANNGCFGEVKKKTGTPIFGSDSYSLSRCTGECDPSTPCKASLTTGAPGSIGETGEKFCGCGGAPEAEPGCCHIAYGVEWVDDGNGQPELVATGVVTAFGSCSLAACPVGGSCTKKTTPISGGALYTAYCTGKVGADPTGD